MEYQSTEIKIVQSGAPVIEDAWIVYKSDQVILIEVGMKSKYCRVNASSGNSVFICAEEDSRFLDETVDRHEDTWAEFPEADGYEFFSASASRYTIHLTFFRR